MKKIDIGQLLHTLANAGVIAGIIFLAMELRQNNELLQLEAKAILVENLQDGWYQIVSDPGLAEIFIKDRSNETLSEVEEMRLNAYWMGMLLRREWQFQHFPESSNGWEGMKRLFTSYGSLNRTWHGETSASRAAGKDSFSPEFVLFMEDQIIPGQ